MSAGKEWWLREKESDMELLLWAFVLETEACLYLRAGWIFGYVSLASTRDGSVRTLPWYYTFSHAYLQGSPPVLAPCMHEQTELWHEAGVAACL